MKNEEMQWLSSDGLKLFAQKWLPEAEPAAVICLVHGLGEHSGRYRHWAEELTGAGYALYSFDLRGHGKSEGLRGDAPTFDHLGDDISIMLQEAEKHFPSRPLFLYGHSLGGSLALYYLAQRQPQICGAVVTSPSIKSIADDQKVKLFLGRLLSYVFPKLCIPNGLDPNHLSRDSAVVKAYTEDPLVHDRISLRMAKGMIDAAAYVFDNASELQLPILLMHGTADKITYAEGSKKLAALAPDKCTLKLYESYFHELHNEPEKDQVFGYLRQWLENRLK